MLKKFVRHGNTFAIPIDKRTMRDAFLSRDTLFEIQVLPGGGVYIHSVEEINRDKIKREFDEISEKYDQLFKNLSDK